MGSFSRKDYENFANMVKTSKEVVDEGEAIRTIAFDMTDIFKRDPRNSFDSRKFLQACDLPDADIALYYMTRGR